MRQGKGAEKAGRNEKAVSAQEDSILLSLAGTQRLQVCTGLGQAISRLYPEFDSSLRLRAVQAGPPGKSAEAPCLLSPMPVP